MMIPCSINGYKYASIVACNNDSNINPEGRDWGMQRQEEKFKELFGEVGFEMEATEVYKDGAWLSIEDMEGGEEASIYIQDSQLPGFLQALRIAYNAGISE